MKLQICTILFLSFTCCKSVKNYSGNRSFISEKNDSLECKQKYLITSIYLNDSTYIIHAFRNDSLFKIVSPLKEPLFLPPMLKGVKEPCEELKEGMCYSLVIHSLFEIYSGDIVQDSGQISIVSFGPHRGALRFNGSTITFDKESNYELYYSKNIKGKCYIKN